MIKMGIFNKINDVLVVDTFKREGNGEGCKRGGEGRKKRKEEGKGRDIPSRIGKVKRWQPYHSPQ